MAPGSNPDNENCLQMTGSFAILWGSFISPLPMGTYFALTSPSKYHEQVFTRKEILGLLATDVSKAVLEVTAFLNLVDSNIADNSHVGILLMGAAIIGTFQLGIMFATAYSRMPRK